MLFLVSKVGQHTKVEICLGISRTLIFVYIFSLFYYSPRERWLCHLQDSDANLSESQLEKVASSPSNNMPILRNLRVKLSWMNVAILWPMIHRTRSQCYFHSTPTASGIVQIGDHLLTLLSAQDFHVYQPFSLQRRFPHLMSKSHEGVKCLHQKESEKRKANWKHTQSQVDTLKHQQCVQACTSLNE